MRRQLFGGLLAATLVAFPLACGDDDDDGGLPAAGGDTTEAEADDSEETEPPATEGDDTADTEPTDTEAETDETASDSGDVSGGDLVRWCEINADLDDDDPFDAIDDDSPPDEVAAAFDEVESRLDEYVDVTPDEIKDDVERIASAFFQLRDAMEENDYDIETVTTDPELTDLFNDPALDEAQTRIDEFDEEHCS